MSAKRKTVLKGFDYMHCDDFAKYLSDMAAKGWHFVEWGVGLKFEKGEPEQVVYAVEVFPRASENDVRPEPDTQEFAEYCEAAGWKLIDAKQKFCIFKKIKQDATELFTPEERVNNALKGTFSGPTIALLVLYGLNAVLRWSNLATMFENNIFSGSFFFGISVWTVLLIEQLMIILYAFCKSRKLKKKIRAGEKIHIGNCQDGKYHINIKDISVILLIVLLMYYFYLMERTSGIILNAMIVIGTFGLAVIINKIRPERDMNIIIQIVFGIVLMIFILFSAMISFMDNEENELVPLTITDYRECDGVVEDTSIYEESNFLGSKSTYYVLGEKESIYYDVYKSEYTWALDKIWEDEINGKKYNEGIADCTADWDAKMALRNKIGTYYVRYEDSILVLSEDEDVYLSEEQIDIILDKLGLR